VHPACNVEEPCKKTDDHEVNLRQRSTHFPAPDSSQCAHERGCPLTDVQVVKSKLEQTESSFLGSEPCQFCNDS